MPEAFDTAPAHHSNLSEDEKQLAKLGYNALATHDPSAASVYFHEALKIAWSAQALPRALDALVGMATVWTTDHPERAASLAALVRRHPAGTQESRDRAAAILEQLCGLSAVDLSSMAEGSFDVQSMEMIVTTLMSEIGPAAESTAI